MMLDETDIPALMEDMGQRARAAARVLATAGSERKYAALISAAHAIESREQEILDANAEDLGYAEARGLSPAMTDRLILDPRRIRAMVFIIWTSALTLSSALASWRSPMTALNTVSPASTTEARHHRCRPD